MWISNLESMETIMKESKFLQIQDAFPLLKNKEKYTGTRPLTLRSSWEISFVFKYLDVNVNIVSWKSESTIIKYRSVLDNQMHRYFMDFTVIAKTNDGKTKELWIEIKPQKSTMPPQEPKRKTQSYLYQVREYLKNQSKWETTKQIIKEKQAQGINIDFAILTEAECPWFVK